MNDKHRNPALRDAAAAFIGALLPALLPPIREVARQHGYAVAVHGSLARDIDLVAVPWIEGAEDPDELVRSVRGAVASVLGRCYFRGDDGKPEWTEKPHGRRAVTLIHAGHVGDIDFSVMPRILPPPEPQP